MTIDNRRNYYVTLDTETLGLTSPSIYDFGWATHDKQGNIFTTGNYLIQEVFKPHRMATAYFADKVPMYDKLVSEGKLEVLPFREVMRRFDESLKPYPNMTLGAYNLPFDMGAIKFTKEELGIRSKLLSRPVQTQDIRSLCYETICSRQKGYEKFAVANNLLSPKGFLSTTAESLYRYMILDADFIEDHTALSDVLIEVELWAWALRQKQKYTKIGVRNNFDLLKRPT